MRTGNDIKCTILASGSEVALTEVYKLATRNIYSKIISVPCLDILKKFEEINLKFRRDKYNFFN